MTIAGWILFGIITVPVIVIAALIGSLDYKLKGAMIGGGIGLILTILILVGMLFYFNRTEAGKRAYKTQESSLMGGIERTVRVFDMEGNLIQEYSGKFDVVYDNDRILFDDEKGKRHVIYYPTGTVIIDEN